MVARDRVVLSCLIIATSVEAQTPLLARNVAISAENIAFSSAGKIWIVPRAGGEAHAVTTGTDDDFPVFSPDGARIAFTRGGPGADIYVAPITGGALRRLTFHPRRDVPVSWTGDRITFFAERDGEASSRLFTVGVNEGPIESVPLPTAEHGSWSPDGTRIAYSPVRTDRNRARWRYYRGGVEAKIWIARVADGAIERVPHGDWNDRLPMWVGERIYFISDRTDPYNLYSFDPRSKQTRKLTTFKEFGIDAAASTADAIALLRDGELYVYAIATAALARVPVTMTADTSEAMPRAVPAGRWTTKVALSANGDRAVVTARGDVFTMRLDAGAASVQHITSSSATAERHATLSPDARSVAFFSDSGGTYRLHIRSLDGTTARVIAVEDQPTFYWELSWSPDGRRLAFSDKRLQLWIADLTTGKATVIARSTFRDGSDDSNVPGSFQPTWSPDGRYLAFSMYGENRLRRVHAYDVAAARVRAITDGKRHAERPAFDASGRFLYVSTSPDATMGELFGVMSMFYRANVSRRIELVVLRASDRAPFLSNGAPDPEFVLTTQPTTIDFDGIDARIVSLPLERRDVSDLRAGPPGVVYATSYEWASTPALGVRTIVLDRISLDAPSRAQRVADGVESVVVSADGKTLLVGGGGRFSLITANDRAAETWPRRAIDLNEVRLQVEPRVEWTQMYHEAWRISREWFYDPGLHGIDAARLEAHYARFLPAVTRREDLNQLLDLSLGWFSISHRRVAGGDIPAVPRTDERLGALGADFDVDRGRYRVRRVYRSVSFAGGGSNLGPLDQPGMNVRAGEYLIAIDDRDVTTSRTLEEALVGTADRPTRITLASRPDGADARTITVVPMRDDARLRRFNWAEDNRRIVEEKSGGRLGYIYLPIFGSYGIESFVRDFLAATDKKGLIIDERFSPGGAAADAFIEMLFRKPLYHYAMREGADMPYPVHVVPGPRVLLTNEENASAAETFALMFKEKGGLTVGQRTYGGGIGGFNPIPELLDRGAIAAPNRGGYNSRLGRWEIENRGVVPDISVEALPRDLHGGRDAQLERAIAEALQRLGQNQFTVKRPAYPIHPR